MLATTLLVAQRLQPNLVCYSTRVEAGWKLVLAVTGRPCDTNTEVGALELLTLEGVDEGALELATDEAGTEPVNDTAIVWLAEIALNV